MKRFPMLIATLGLLVVCAACTAAAPTGDTSSTSPAAAAPTAAATSEPSASGTAAPASPTAQAGGGGGDAAALCALIIDINTRGGYMVNKQFIDSPTTEQVKAITLESVARKDEIISLTPPELRAGMVAELAYLQSLADWAVVHGWDATDTSADAPTLPPDFLANLEALNTFQKTTCGITFP
jgi:hypothetical protein